MTPEQRQRLSQALRNSEKFQKAIVERNKKYRYRRPRKGTRSKRASHPRDTISIAESMRVKAEVERKLRVHCILLTERLLKRLVRERDNHQVLCHKCDELLHVGDIVVPRSNSNRHGKPKRKYYHVSCWEEMFFE